MIVGPLAIGAMVSFRTRVANSHPGKVTSATQSMMVI